MTAMIRSLVHRVLDPWSTCRDATKCVTATVRCSQNLVRRSANMVVRPFLWPVHLSADLTRRVIIQVLISLKEILEALDEMIDALQHRLATSDRHQLPELEFKQAELSAPSSHQMALPLSRDQAQRAWKQHLVGIRKLRHSNLGLRRRVQQAETKYGELEAEVGGLKEMYRDTLSTMDSDLSDLKEQREHVLNIIQCAQALTGDCQEDAQKLMDELQTQKVSPQSDTHSLCSGDSLSLDLSLEGLTLTSQQLAWGMVSDSDTGYGNDTDYGTCYGTDTDYGTEYGSDTKYSTRYGNDTKYSTPYGNDTKYSTRYGNDIDYGTCCSDDTESEGTESALPIQRVFHRSDILSASSSVMSLDNKL